MTTNCEQITHCSCPALRQIFHCHGKCKYGDQGLIACPGPYYYELETILYFTMMNNIEKIYDNIWLLRIPQPYYEPVNVYLIKGPSHTLIDSGHYFSTDILGKMLKKCHVDLDQVERVLCTHPHVDHVGGYVRLAAAGLNHRTRLALHAQVAEHSDYWSTIHIRVHDLLSTMRQEVSAFYHDFSFQQTKEFGQRCFPLEGQLPLAQKLFQGQHLQAGPYQLEVIETPGHNPYHVCFLNEKEGLLFSGDVMLREGTSIIEAMGDSHTAYLTSLDELEELHVQLVLPAHGRSYDSAQIAVKIARRLYYYLENSILRVLDKPRTAYEIARLVFGQHLVDIEYAFIGYARIKSYLNKLAQLGTIVCETNQNIEIPPLYRKT